MGKEEIKEGYTRVTEIIGWYKSLIHGAIDQNVLKAKAQVGSNVHEAIEQDGSGVFVPLTEKELGYFNSYLKWKLITPHRSIRVENRFYCDKLKITGAIDMVAYLENANVPSLVDFKTSAAEDKIGWALQATFYRYLILQNLDDLDENAYFIKLDKEGKKPKVCKYIWTETLWQDAKKCLDVYRFWNHK